jgi:hypothetical protein
MQSSDSSYKLEIHMLRDDSLFIKFLGPGQFPIGLLELRGKDGELSGQEWKLERLAPGECVAAWKDTGRPEIPDNLECKLVGERLEFEGQKRFWKTKFDVFFAGERLGECKPGKDGCIFTIEDE